MLVDTKSQRRSERLQARCVELNKEVERKPKADKRAFIEKLADEASRTTKTLAAALETAKFQ